MRSEIMLEFVVMFFTFCCCHAWAAHRYPTYWDSPLWVRGVWPVIGWEVVHTIATSTTGRGFLLGSAVIVVLAAQWAHESAAMQ